MEKQINIKLLLFFGVLISILIITLVLTMQNPLKDASKLQRGTYASTGVIHDTNNELVHFALSIETHDMTFSLWADNILADEGEYKHVGNTKYSFSGQVCDFVINDFNIDKFSLSLPNLNGGKSIEFFKTSEAITSFGYPDFTDDEMTQKKDEAKKYLE